MKKRFRFEDLEVWQEARRLNREVYRITRRFPAAEQFGLAAQLRRASVSVSSNIAEGSGRNSDRDFAHFLENAYGSLMEVASQLFLAFDEEYVDEATLNAILENARALSAKIAALNRSLLVKASKVSLPKPSALDLRPSTPE
jgi:four helix bundle protein